MAALPQLAGDSIPAATATPQLAATHPPQTPARAPDSPMVHRSAESIVARVPAAPAAQVGAEPAAQSASKARAGAGNDDDVELAPEETGFAGHSDDAFAGMVLPVSNLKVDRNVCVTNTARAVAKACHAMRSCHKAVPRADAPIWVEHAS